MSNKTIINLQQRLTNRLNEAFDQLWGNFVDPAEAYRGSDGSTWQTIGAYAPGQSPLAAPFIDEASHAEIRNQCRRLAATNEFAINGHENRISHVVGTGHVYRVSVRKGSNAAENVAAEAQRVLDRFLHEAHWKQRQQEIVRRLDRDGEAFLRFFVDFDGTTRVRFVEPDQIQTPQEFSNNPAHQFGIETLPDDVETVLNYWVDGVRVQASEIQHRKTNVDRNVRRGLPLFYPVQSNLMRAEKLLRNMSIVSEIQSAIALIRRYPSSTSGVEDICGTESCSEGSTRYFSQYRPGTILDAPAGLEYDFPAAGLDASNFVVVLQAELRAIAARLVMPEFMFTSDASNANYASSLVAEGPAIKMFERLQATLMDDDCRVMWRVLENAAAAGALPGNIRDLVEVQISPPALTTRDQLRDARVEQIANAAGVLSLQTWSQRLGLDYDQEQKNLQMHSKETESLS